MTSRITDLEQRLAAAESRSATAFRDGMEEAARIGGVAAAQFVRRFLGACDLHPGAVINATSGVRRAIDEAIRSRASSLPGGETIGQTAVALRRIDPPMPV